MPTNVRSPQTTTPNATYTDSGLNFHFKSTRVLLWGPHKLTYSASPRTTEKLHQTQLKINHAAKCCWKGNTEFASTFHRFLNNLAKFNNPKLNEEITEARKLVNDAHAVFRTIKSFQKLVEKAIRENSKQEATEANKKRYEELQTMLKIADSIKLPDELTPASVDAYEEKTNALLPPLVDQLAAKPQVSAATPAADTTPNPVKSAIHESLLHWTSAFDALAATHPEASRLFTTVRDVRTNEWESLEKLADTCTNDTDKAALEDEIKRQQRLDHKILSLLKSEIDATNTDGNELRGPLGIIQSYFNHLVEKGKAGKTAEAAIEALRAADRLGNNKFLDTLREEMSYFYRHGYDTLADFLKDFIASFEEAEKKQSDIDAIPEYIDAWNALLDDLEDARQILVCVRTAEEAFQGAVAAFAARAIELGNSAEESNEALANALLNGCSFLNARASLQETVEICNFVEQLAELTEKINKLTAKLGTSGQASG